MGTLPKATKRRDLVKRLRELGWDGPHKGTGPHPEYMAKGTQVTKLPNDHRGDIREPLLKRVLEQAGISVDEWTGKGTADHDDEHESDEQA